MTFYEPVRQTYPHWFLFQAMGVARQNYHDKNDVVNAREKG